MALGQPCSDSRRLRLSLGSGSPGHRFPLATDSPWVPVSPGLSVGRRGRGYRRGVHEVNELIAVAVRAAGRGTQTRLAQRAEVSVGTVSHWVNGRALPERRRWPVIEDELGLARGAISTAFAASLSGADEADASARSADELDVAVRSLRNEVADLRDRLERLERAERPRP